MADKTILELEPVTAVYEDDSFVLQQGTEAKRLTGELLMQWLAVKLDGHGGINRIVKTLPSTGLTDHYTIYYADSTTSTFDITNGRAITSIAYDHSDGFVDTYVISYNDDTTSTFTVTNGRSISNVTVSSAGLVDTYTIHFNDNTTYQFDVDNGRGITNVTKESAGLVDTYTIHYNDNTTTTFDVQNGRSITGIAKDSTVGLVDTYVISYNDSTHDTFNVTNGEKGDNSYTWVKYSHTEPTQDSDMHDTADDWMGIHTGNESTAPTTYTSYTWYKIKGAKGNKGDNTYVSDTITQYQVGDNGYDIPQTWLDNVPNVPSGKYLWTKVTINFSPSGESVFYMSARSGIDGGGGGNVRTVNNVSPDSDGDVPLVRVSGTTLVIG